MSKSEKKKAFLITGFGPFKGHPINASWESVKLLPNLWKHDQIELVLDEIPVSYEFVKCQVTEKWADHDPIFYVHVGVSSYAEKVTLETVGHNACYDKPDINGYFPESKWYVEYNFYYIQCVPARGGTICRRAGSRLQCIFTLYLLCTKMTV